MSGLVIAVVIRFLIIKRPMEVSWAIGVSFIFVLFSLVIRFYSEGISFKPIPMSLAFYWILRAEFTKDERVKNRSFVNQTSGDGTTSLMVAAMIGDGKQVKELISAGANIDAIDSRGWTSLMHAASNNEVEVIEYLLRSGADPTVRNNENHTAAEIAQRKGYDEAAETIQNHLKIDKTSNVLS
ncbi:MAG TPA: ankyrin repeat domain-containing protein [Candidatus Desulfobacillus sp.]|nr:ankyrin repeat domain-containing protein [Candidatus Desulfobacillus sp.]